MKRGPISSKITQAKEKERRNERARRKKEGETRKKTMVALLALFWLFLFLVEKTLLCIRGLFGGS